MDRSGFQAKNVYFDLIVKCSSLKPVYNGPEEVVTLYITVTGQLPKVQLPSCKEWPLYTGLTMLQ